MDHAHHPPASCRRKRSDGRDQKDVCEPQWREANPRGHTARFFHPRSKELASMNQAPEPTSPVKGVMLGIGKSSRIAPCGRYLSRKLRGKTSIERHRAAFSHG